MSADDGHVLHVLPALAYRKRLALRGGRLNGGILGIAAGTILGNYVATLGTTIVVVCTWLVGAVLLADAVVLALLRRVGMTVLRLFGLAGPAFSAARESGREMADIWKRLSARQRAARQEAAAAAPRQRTPMTVGRGMAI